MPWIQDPGTNQPNQDDSWTSYHSQVFRGFPLGWSSEMSTVDHVNLKDILDLSSGLFFAGLDLWEMPLKIRNLGMFFFLALKEKSLNIRQKTKH